MQVCLACLVGKCIYFWFIYKLWICITMWVSPLFYLVVFIHTLSKLPVADYLSTSTPLCLLHQSWCCTSATPLFFFFYFFIRELPALKLRTNNNLQTCVCCCWFPSGTNHSHRNSLWTASAKYTNMPLSEML